MEYSIPEVTAEAIIQGVEAVSKKANADLDYLSKYLNKSAGYTRRVIIMGEQLGIFDLNGDFISLSQDSYSIIKKTADLQLLFKEAFLNYKPFVMIAEFIIKGEEVKEAIRKTAIVFGIGSSVSIIRQVLNNFCKNLGLSGLSKEGIEEVLSENLSVNNEYIRRITKAVESSFNAQIFLSEKLGQGCFTYITDAERKLLGGALSKFSRDPPNSIDDAIGALESFLRRIGDEKNIDLEEANGLYEVGQRLGSKTNKIILSEHREMCGFLSAFRNPSSHKVHKSLLEIWQIEEDSAIEVILLVLTFMRSVYSYIYCGEKLIL